MPDLFWENHCWNDGFLFVAGVDEVGRGALAGPVVAAAVVFPRFLALTSRVQRFDDSKVLSAKTRIELTSEINSLATASGIGMVTAEDIDEIGISRANRLAMERAIGQLKVPVDFLLLDAITCETSIPQTGLIDGDAISISIAAASILAKTYRDRLMCEAHERDNRYCFHQHVGYGTPAHLAALRKYGPSPLHRHTFRGVLSPAE